MNDATSDPAGTAAPESTTNPEVGPSLLRRLGNGFVVFWVLFVIIGQAYLWLVMDPMMGRSIQMLVTQSGIILSTIILLGWLLFLCRFPWKVRGTLAALIALGVLGFIASIRSVEFTGDMQMVIRFRWEPTQAERLEAFRSASTPAAPVADYPIAEAEDAPAYRGLARDGVITGPVLSENWETSPPPELWRRPCGGGYASLAILAPFAVTIEQRGENEAIVCYDTETGSERWVHTYPALFEEAMGGVGPRATPTIHDGAVFSLGAFGDLICLNLLDGEVKWEVNILADNNLQQASSPSGLLNAMWAMSGSPLIVDETVVVNAGGPDGDGLVAYAVETGDKVWTGAGLKEPVITESSQNRAGYSSPVLVEIAGIRQILIFDGVGMRSCRPETGEQLWFYQFDEGGGDPGRVNVAQPLLLDGDRVFISASYGRGCAMLQVSGNGETCSVECLWSNRNLRSKFSSPVLHNGYIYGLDEAVMVCLDPKTGARRWKGGRYGHGQMLLTNDRILLFAESGELVLIDPSPEELKELTRLRVLGDLKNWNPLALSRGRVYIRNHFEITCLDLRAERE